MGSVYKRGRTWWLKYKDAAGAWKPEATKAATKTEAKALLHEIERRVERQRLGLEPLSLNPDGWTVADLMQWWLDTYSRHSPSHERNVGTGRRHILESALATKPLEHVRSGDVEQLPQAMEGELSASTISHVRQFLVGAFNRAREAAVPALRLQALAEGERPDDPLPRSPAHLRERAAHVGRGARLGAAAARALRPEDHRAPLWPPARGTSWPQR